MRNSLNVSISATFLSSGDSTRAVATIGPKIYGTSWNVTRIISNTTSSGDNGQSKLQIYSNYESPSNLVDGTYSADQDINETELSLYTLESLLFVWTGGDLDAIATGIIVGTVEDGR